MLGGLGGALGNLGGIAAGLGIGAVAGIGAVGVGLGKLAIDAAPLAGIQGAFEGVTSSFEGGSSAMLQALQESSLGMVTNQELMTSFNSAAQLVSVDFAEKLPDAMQYLGKVSAATGQDMGFMIDSLVKGVGRMSPMILDNLGVQVNLEAATARAAEMFGVEADQLDKAQIQAGLMDVTLAALATNTAAMPDVAGSASQGLASLTTTLANTKDQIGLALLPILTPLLQKLGELAAQFLPMVVLGFQQFVGMIQTQVMPWVQANLIPILMQLGAWLGKEIPKFLQFLSQVWVNVLKPALQTVWAFIQDPLIPIIMQIADWLKVVLPPIIKALADFWTNVLLPAIQKVWKFITVDLLPIWEAIADLLGPVLSLIITAMAGLWENVLWPAIKAVAGWLDKTFRPIIEWVVGIFKTWVERMGGIKGIIDRIADGIKALTDKIKDFTNNMPDWLIPGSPTPFELGLRGIAEAARELRRVGPDLTYGLQTAPIRAAPALGLATPGGATTNNYFNQVIHTTAEVEPIAQSFEAMRSLVT